MSQAATGDVLVGAFDGQVITLDSTGTVETSTTLPNAVKQLHTAPTGAWYAIDSTNTIWKGSPWSQPRTVGTSTRVAVGCSGLETDATDLFSDPNTSSVALRSCSDVIHGGYDGTIDGHHVTESPIIRVLPRASGVLWVDGGGAVGCLDCEWDGTSQVKDIIQAHSHPFVQGEYIWIDGDDRIWADSK